MKDHDLVNDPHAIDTDFGSLTVRNELPGTVDLAVDDGLGATRVLLLQPEEAYQLSTHSTPRSAQLSLTPNRHRP